MSIPVSLERLRAAAAERGPAAYVLTVSGDGSPHAVHAVDGTAIVVSGPAGQRLLVTPTRAVLHRAASAPGGTDAQCQADCVPLQQAAQTR